MTYTKPLTAIAIALALPVTAASAVLAGTPSDVPTATTTTVAGRPTLAPASADVADPGTAEPGRILGELDADGRPPRWFDPGALPLRSGGGTPAGPQSVDAYSAGPWCIYQCITKGVAYAHGDGVELVVETSVPADIQLIVCRDDDGDFDCDYLATEWTGSLETEFHWVIDPLDPGTYWVTAGATDANGDSSLAFGEFTLA
jgi:hypothetical protein